MKARLLSIFCILLMSLGIQAHDIEPLHVDGRYLKNSKGDIVTLHGLQKNVSAWIDRMGTIWDGEDFEGAVKYQKEWIDSLLMVDWKINYIRLGIDFIINQANNHDLDNFMRRSFFDKVYIPFIDYLNSKGIYAVLYYGGIRAEGDTHKIGDSVQQYALEFWDYISSHPKIRNNPGVMMELYNEPVFMVGNDGHHEDFRDVKNYFQPMIDVIRKNDCNCVVWVPGLGYQAVYAGFATNPMMGENIGYAFHAYSHSYRGFNYEWIKEKWDEQIKPVGNMAPLMITETYWNNEEESTSVYGIGLKRNIDELGNVSWNPLIDHCWDVLRVNQPSPDGSKTEYNDYEYPIVPIWNWFKEYAETKVIPVSQLKAVKVWMEDAPTTVYPGYSRALKLMVEFTNGNTWDVAGDAVWSSSDETVACIDRGNIYVKKEGKVTIHGSYTDGTGQTFEVQFDAVSAMFPLTAVGVTILAYDTEFDETTQTFSGVGEGGWTFPNGIDLSPYRYIVVRLNEMPMGPAMIWLDDGIQEESYKTDLSWQTEVVVDLQTQTEVDLTHIEKVLIWKYGPSVSIKEIFLSNDCVNPVKGEPLAIHTLVNIDDKAMRYGDEVPELTYSVVGNVPSRTPTLSTTATRASAVGMYDISIEGNEDNVDYYPGNLHVIPAPLTASTGTPSLAEGEMIPVITPTYDGFKNGDTEETAIIVKPKTQPMLSGWAIAGLYPVYLNGNGKTNGNYVLDYGQTGMVTVKESEDIKKYGVDLTARVGVSPEDWHTWGATDTKYAPAVTTSDGRQVQMMEVWRESPADKTGEIMYQTISGLDNGEYLVGVYANARKDHSVQGFDFEEGANDMVYVAANDVRVYIPAYTEDYLINGNGVCGIRTKVTDGTLRISMVAEKIGTNWHTIQIKKLIKLPETTVTADNKTMVYGDEVPELTYTTNGPTVDGTPQLTTTATSASPVGTYPIKVEKGTVTNEMVTYVEGTLTITRAPLTVGVQDETITEGDAIPMFTLTYSGFRNSDTEGSAFTTKPTATTTATASSKPGIYPITVSGGEATNYALTYTQGTLTIKEMDIMMGDLNDDRSVSITDVVLIIDVIAGSITDAKKVKAADVNKDGSVTITDCVAAIDLIAAQSKSVRMNKASAMLVSTDFISASMKDNLLTVNFDNENRYAAFQMVVTMPEGMTLDKAAIDELRATDYQLAVRNLGNGQYLLAGYSMGNNELAGNSGRLLTITTNGHANGDIVISDIEFATAEAEAYYLAPISISSTATGIYQIENRDRKQDDVIFDLQGRRVNQPTHGLYIVNGKLIKKKYVDNIIFSSSCHQ